MTISTIKEKRAEITKIALSSRIPVIYRQDRNILVL